MVKYVLSQYLFTNKMIINRRLCPWCTTHGEYLLVSIVKQNLVETSAVMFVIFYCKLAT